MRGSRSHPGVVVAVALALVAVAGASAAQFPSGWAPLGQVQLDKSGCASCPAVFPTSGRHRSFGLATDTPYPVSLSGRVDVACANGTTYEVLLRSSTRGGLFQVVPNSCVNLDVKELKLTISTASLSPPDAERAVVLTVYGRVG